MITISGLCAKSQTIEWNQLDAWCVGEARVDATEKLSPKVRGEGVKLGALLAAVEPDVSVTHVMIGDGDKYRPVCPRRSRERGGPGHRLDGAPLPDELGGPVRLLVPSNTNACLSVKRVRRVELLDHVEPDTVPTVDV